MGDRLHGRKSAASALETIYAVQRDQTRPFLTTPNVYTKRRPYLGIAADKVCEKQFASWEVVNGRVNYMGTPVSFALELRAIESESANADACLREIDGAADGLGVQASQRLSYVLLRRRSLLSGRGHCCGSATLELTYTAAPLRLCSLCVFSIPIGRSKRSC